MALPEQIQKQIDEANKHYSQANTQDETDDQQVDDGQDTDEQDDQQLDASQDDQQDDQHDDQTDDQTEDDALEADVTDDLQAAGQSKRKKRQTIYKKYQTLQGMYNSEVPQLQRQVRELGERNRQLEQLITTMSAAPAASQQAQSKRDLVTQEDIDEYGESIDVMRKVSQEEYDPLVQRLAQLEQQLGQLNTRVVPQVQNLSQQQARSEEQRFWSTMDSTVPQWREINDNPDFQTWLLQPDQLTGVSRQALLEDAHRGLNAQRVAAFFNTWVHLSGYKSNNTADRRASELDRQIAPGRGRNSGVPAGNDTGKTYTAADITEFYANVRKGAYRGRDKERAKIEQDIFKAQNDGRIVS